MTVWNSNLVCRTLYSSLDHGTSSEYILHCQTCRSSAAQHDGIMTIIKIITGVSRSYSFTSLLLIVGKELTMQVIQFQLYC